MFNRFWSLLLAAVCVLPLSRAAAQTQQTAAEEIGSLRNARVAIPVTDTTPELTYFAGSLSPEERDELARMAPNLRIVTGLTPAQALARAGEAHGVEARYATPEFLKQATNLAWVQAMSAGVDNLLGNEALATNDRILLTNHRGVHGPAIADHALAMLLSLTRDLRHQAENQARRTWGRGNSELTPVALDGRTMLVVGIGGIGSEIAKRAKAFGMTVWATRRSEAPKPEYVDRVELSPALLSLLPQADVVAIAAPLTPETQGLFNQQAFAAMKPGAYLVNIARGPIVVTEELVAALRSGKLAGACLDVIDPEPLPANSPLWEMRNVVITPHVAAHAEVTQERRWALVRENLRRFAAGEPLMNVV
ncbi:MAG: D-2-hydroxyacid dehydrogenase, partial [Verrucomicrobiae bacterium]|nr:D-2-hydroxyacid dehydrogenase [Verrucomicrobiae bacterium]